MLKIILMVAYAIVGIIFLAGFLGDRDIRVRDRCLIGVISMGLLELVTALLL